MFSDKFNTCYSKQKTDSGKTLIGKTFKTSTVICQYKSDRGRRVWILSCGLCCNFYKSITKELNKGRKTNCGCRRRGVIVGEKYGRLLAVKLLGGRQCGCICDCGQAKSVSCNNIITGHTKTCGCSQYSINHHEFISARFYHSVYRSAITRGLEFSLTPDDIWEIYLKQNKKCFYTGLDIVFAKNWKEMDNLIQTASLDRIDNSKGYDKNNIRLVHKQVNIMRGPLTDGDFIKLCVMVANKHGDINE